MEHFRLINLDKTKWEQWHPQFKGTFAKTIYIDKNTGANLRQAFLPSGFSLKERKRHHHGDTREGVYTLFGNVKYQEFENPKITKGKENNFQKDFLLDRPPYSIHGPKIGDITDLGCLILEWGSGPLHFNYIPFDGNLDDYENDYNTPLVVNSKKVDWIDHPTIEGIKIKFLSEGGKNKLEGFHPICKIFIPPGWNKINSDGNLLGEDFRKWFYVLHGDLPIKVIDEKGNQILNQRLVENEYFEWFSPTKLLICDNEESNIGCELLCVGHDFS